MHAAFVASILVLIIAVSKVERLSLFCGASSAPMTAETSEGDRHS